LCPDTMSCRRFIKYNMSLVTTADKANHSCLGVTLTLRSPLPLPSLPAGGCTTRLPFPHTIRSHAICPGPQLLQYHCCGRALEAHWSRISCAYSPPSVQHSMTGQGVATLVVLTCHSMHLLMLAGRGSQTTAAAAAHTPCVSTLQCTDRPPVPSNSDCCTVADTTLNTKISHEQWAQPVPVQYNIVDRDAYMQDVIHNVEGSSVQHHTKTRPPTNLISSAQLGSLGASAPRFGGLSCPRHRGATAGSDISL
jgi:hypothetical protein